MLQWSTSEEVNFSHFEIERSATGRGTWTFLREYSGDGAQVQGEGQRSYVFTDEMPLQKGYYRLKMVDLDGSFAYSEVVFLERELAAEPVVFPNPSNGQFFLQTPDEQSSMIMVSDLNGRIVSQATYQSQRQDFSHLRPGVYLLTVRSTNEQWTKRVVIQ
ncbi:MAG: T9SS type A sorting domain-containing protein [Bacteroidota bacterium]